jgi:hypothetical protein
MASVFSKDFFVCSGSEDHPYEDVGKVAITLIFNLIFWQNFGSPPPKKRIAIYIGKF